MDKDTSQTICFNSDGKIIMTNKIHPLRHVLRGINPTEMIGNTTEETFQQMNFLFISVFFKDCLEVL